MTAAQERFWAKVDKSGDCWEWTASLNSMGYGKMYYEGRLWLSHRLSWMWSNGLIPDGAIILHKCDNPKCVRPDHLRAGTYRDNSHDALRKGRHRSPGLPGAKNGRAKLNDGQVRAIRRHHSAGATVAHLSRQYGISSSQISEIVRGLSWAEPEVTK